MSLDKILLEYEDNIARITLNDPETINALSMEMMGSLLEKLADAEAKARVIILTGAGRGFCSGANLVSGSGAGEEGVDAGAPLIAYFNPVIRKIQDLTIPIITQVRGAAAGYGASLALSGDLVVGSEKSFFVQAFRDVGLVPDGGSAYMLVKSIGRIRATELMLLAEKLPAQKALDWGLITRVVPDDELESTVNALAKNLANGASVALGMTRRMAWRASEVSLSEELDQEVQLQRWAGNTADHREGVAAFKERRKAKFIGK